MRNSHLSGKAFTRQRVRVLTIAGYALNRLARMILRMITEYGGVKRLRALALRVLGLNDHFDNWCPSRFHAPMETRAQTCYRAGCNLKENEI